MYFIFYVGTNYKLISNSRDQLEIKFKIWRPNASFLEPLRPSKINSNFKNQKY